jgi:hypothetical protein
MGGKTHNELQIRLKPLMLTHEQDLIRKRVREVAELIRSSTEEHRCIRCNQKLTDSESIERQMGPDCWKQMNAASEMRVVYGHSDEPPHADTYPEQYITIYAWCPRPRCSWLNEVLAMSSFEGEAADEVRQALHATSDPAGQEILAQFILEGAVDKTQCDYCQLDYMELDDLSSLAGWSFTGKDGYIKVWSERDDLMEVYQDSMR